MNVNVSALLGLLACLTVGWVAPVEGAYFYVAANGTANGDGSIQSPWNLTTALRDNTKPANSNSVVKPGDTIWLRGGIYTNYNGYVSDLAGASGNPIIVRAYPGERPIVDGNYNGTGGSGVTFAIRGGWTYYRDFEVMNSYTNRDSVTGRPTGVDVGGNYGPCHDVKCINLVVHDVGVGIGMWVGATNSGIYGCVIYNVGYENVPPDRGHGHAIYVQNRVGTQQHYDNIMVNSFDVGMQAYGQSAAAALNNLDIQGNVAFNSGSTAQPSLGTKLTTNFEIGGTFAAYNILFANNYAYHPRGTNYNGGVGNNLMIGYEPYENNDIIVTNNYVAGRNALALTYWTNAVVSGNTVVCADTYSHPIYCRPGSGTNSWTWDYNTYYAVASNPYNFLGFWYKSADWKTITGFDAHSTFSSGPPTGSAVFVRTNLYDSKRANIVIYNWDLDDNVSVDVSGVLSPGDTYQIRNTQDWFAAPCLSGTYTGGSLSVPMTNLTVAVPIGRATAPAPTSPEFNAFVLLATPGARLLPPSNLRVISP